MNKLIIILAIAFEFQLIAVGIFGTWILKDLNNITNLVNYIHMVIVD